MRFLEGRNRVIVTKKNGFEEKSYMNIFDGLSLPLVSSFFQSIDFSASPKKIKKTRIASAGLDVAELILHFWKGHEIIFQNIQGSSRLSSILSELFRFL